MEDWLRSPTSIFFSNVDNESIFCSNIENVHEPVSLRCEGYNALGNAAQNQVSDWNSLAEPKTGSRRCLKERIAARGGFNAPRLNTESIRHAELSRNLDARSPCMTIPPGLSPTTLLDSPVFLTNSPVLASPTTGKFTLAVNNQHSTLVADGSDMRKENAFDDTSSFAFMRKAEPRSIPQFCDFNNNFQTGSNLSIEQTPFDVTDNSPPLDESGEDDRDRDPHVGGGRVDDGYNWRKYGQKLVKGSEYPRSYYKCTYANCPVKKKVETSEEGHVTEIIYQGGHNHPKPQARRSSRLEPEVGGTCENGDMIWSAVQNHGTRSSVPLIQENNNRANLQVQNDRQLESGDGVEVSSTLSNDEDDNDRVTHGSVSLGYDGEGDESESKRRRIETYASELSGAETARAIREPRVVVQTTSDVDILDDGYRWRKYGQKVVKGNPNPRSYYKCTTPGCNVRKHVERASHDLKSVITTYEGKHNHSVPAARNSSQALPAQIAASAPRSSHIPRPEPLIGTPSLHRPSLGSFGLLGRPQLGVNLPGSLASLVSGEMGNHSRIPVLPAYSNFRQQQQSQVMGGVRYMVPKEEPNSDSNNINSINGSAVYHKLMSQLPSGPQM